MALTLLDYSLGALGVFLLYRFLSKIKLPAPLPPGPRGLPFIGNVMDMPAEKEWITFAEWGSKWGGIIYLNLMGQPMVIVNSAEVLNELERKGSIYSSRPTLQMGGELIGYNKTLVLSPYGPWFRTMRKHFSRLIGSAAAMKPYLPMEEAEGRRFLKNVLATPQDLVSHLRKNAGAVILSLTYGIKTQEPEDPFVNLIEKANANFISATVPGAFLVDYFPLMKYIPEWFPGGGFKTLARVWAQSTADMVEVPYNYTKQQMADGVAPLSFVSSLLDDDKAPTEEDIDIIKFTASSLYSGGADTAVSAQSAFFLAMILYPDVLKTAQAEIDSVIGPDRLPGYADQERLPFVMAVVLEVLRWHSVTPTGVPHMAIEDGIVAGYFIPKKTIIIANLWGMLHDPQVYPDPFRFDPTRHISTADKPAQTDPRTICFGSGRRVCPGQIMAGSSLYIIIALSLAVLDISTGLDEDIPIHENTSGILSFPMPFKFSIKSRSSKAATLIAENTL